MLRKALCLLLLWCPLAVSGPAQAGWKSLQLPLPQEPPIQLLATPDGLLVLHARQLSVLNTAGQVRRAYALNSQTDGLIGIVSRDATWFLASRRTLLSSDDKGFSWRTLDTITARDPNEWLAVLALRGLLLAASGYGIKQIEPGLSTAWGPAGHEAISRAVSRHGALVFETGEDLLAVTGPTTMSRLGVPHPFGLSAALQEGGSLWLAGSRGVVRCNPSCGMFAGPSDVRDLAVFADELWAAAPDGVWRLSLQEQTWQNASAGLGSAPAISLSVWNNALWLLTEGRLFQWEAASQAASSPVDPDPLSHPLRGPAMDEVRRMVHAAQSFVPGEAASWKKRARWRAAAPTVGFSVRQGADEKSAHTLGNTVGLSTTEARIVIGPDGESTSRSSGRATDYGVALTWHLDDLVFSTQELSVNGEAEEAFKLRKTVMLDVTRLYYDRLRVLAERGRVLDEARQIELEIRFDELTADLDFYTGGRFSQSLSQHYRQRAGR